MWSDCLLDLGTDFLVGLLCWTSSLVFLVVPCTATHCQVRKLASSQAASAGLLTSCCRSICLRVNLLDKPCFEKDSFLQVVGYFCMDSKIELRERRIVGSDVQNTVKCHSTPVTYRGLFDADPGPSLCVPVPLHPRHIAPPPPPHCSAVPLRPNPIALRPHCPAVPLHPRPMATLPHCSAVPLRPRPIAPCRIVQPSHYAPVPLHA